MKNSENCASLARSTERHICGKYRWKNKSQIEAKLRKKICKNENKFFCPLAAICFFTIWERLFQNPTLRRKNGKVVVTRKLDCAVRPLLRGGHLSVWSLEKWKSFFFWNSFSCVAGLREDVEFPKIQALANGWGHFVVETTKLFRT